MCSLKYYLANNDLNRKIIKIGTEHGSNFLHCYYFNERTIDRLEKESVECLDRIKRILGENEYELKWLPHAKQVFIQKNKRKPLCERLSMEEIEIKYQKREKSLFRQICSGKRKIKTYKQWLDRNVVKVYDSDNTYEPNTICIIIKGSENGSYWQIDEYAYDKKVFIANKDKHYPQERLEKRGKEVENE